MQGADAIHSSVELASSEMEYETRARSITAGMMAINQIEEVLASLEPLLMRHQENIEFQNKQAAQLRPKIGATFGLDGELELKKAALEELNADLTKDEEEAALAADRQANADDAQDADDANPADDDQDDLADIKADPDDDADPDVDTSVCVTAGTPVKYLQDLTA